MAKIKHPFGGDVNPDFFQVETLTKIMGTASTTKTRKVSKSYARLRVGTVDQKSPKLIVTADDNLPVGSILQIDAQITRGTGLRCATGFVPEGFLIGKADAKGTGKWVVNFRYDGSKFVLNSVVNTAAADVKAAYAAG